MSLRFHLPSLALTNPDRPELHDPGGAEAAGASMDAAYAALWQFDPLLRGLLLAGYELQKLEIGIGSGSAPSVWSVVDLPTMELQAGESSSRNWPSGANLTVAVEVRERVSLTLMPFAMPLSLSGGQLGGAAPGQSTRLEYSTPNPASNAALLAIALDSFGVAADVETIASELAERWSQAADPESLNPFTFQTPPGLLWMFYPQYWYREPSAEPNSRFLHEMSLQLASAISVAPLDFFRLQLNQHQSNAETQAASVHGVAAMTGVRVQMYFISIGKLSDALGGLMSEDWYWNLAGPEPIGHPSTVRYCEVLLHIAEAGLFPFPALADSDVPSHYDFADPYEANLVMLDDVEIGVEVRVFGSQPLQMLRTVDIGYPMRRCLSWEYREPDETGLSKLIVIAAPGVSISGMENIEGLANCELRIYRVQDPELIPEWGEKIQEFLLWAAHDHGNLEHGQLGPEELPEDETDDPAMSYGAPAFRVQPQPLGVRIMYPADANDWDAELIVDITVDAASDRQRFCYDFTPFEQQTPGGRQNYLIQAWATEGVSIKVVHGVGGPVQELFQRLHEPPSSSPMFFDGRTLREMPPPGVQLPALGAPSRLNPEALTQGELNFDRTLLPRLAFWFGIAKMGADVGIGMIPIIGDATDVAEFAASFVTGTDKWGEPVTNFDRALMVGGIALPFVSSGVLRAAARTKAGDL